MKRYIAILFIALAGLLVNPAPAKAQTNVSTNLPSGWGPAYDGFLNLLSQGSNFIVAPYGIMWQSDHGNKFGGGVALAYKMSDFIVPSLRLDYLDGQIFMPSANLTLQAPVTLNNVTVIPFGFSGLATPLSGKQDQNGTAVGIFGVGLAIRLGSKVDILADYEKWTGFSGNQYRFGIAYKF